MKVSHKFYVRKRGAGKLKLRKNPKRRNVSYASPGLLVIPQFQDHACKILMRTEIYHNKVYNHGLEDYIPSYSLRLNTTSHRKYVNDVSRFYSQFALRKSQVAYSLLGELKKDHRLSRFIKEENETFTPAHQPKKGHYYQFKVEYVVVREAVISYLIQTDRLKLANDVQTLFEEVGNVHDYDTYLNLKVKQLTEVNPDDYVAHLNRADAHKRAEWLRLNSTT